MEKLLPKRMHVRRKVGASAFFERGEPSRRALLLAGAAIFGAKGLEGATTREIARSAGQNIASIKYYFDSKEGLYLAIAREIGDEIGSRLNRMGQLLDAPEPFQPRQALDLLKQVIATMVATMMAAESPAIAQFIVREQQNPTAAFDLIYEGGMRGAHETITRLIGLAFDLPDTSMDTVLRAHALMGQVLGFRVARAALLRRTGWKDVGPLELVQVTTAVLAGLELMFEGRARGSAAARPPARKRVSKSRSREPRP